jgi:hypothetical protein
MSSYYLSDERYQIINSLLVLLNSKQREVETKLSESRSEIYINLPIFSKSTFDINKISSYYEAAKTIQIPGFVDDLRKSLDQFLISLLGIIYLHLSGEKISI